MELREIEVFLVLAEELHFRRAAERLYLSTARVSQTVRALEKELGGTLFTRDSRHVALTELGEQFRVDAGRGLEQLREAIARAQSMARNRKTVLRVAYPVTAGSAFVAALASTCQAQHRDIHVSTTVKYHATGFDALRTRSVDILLAWAPGGNTDSVLGDGRVAGPVLASAGRALLVPATHPLARRAEVSLEQIADYPLLDIPTGGPRVHNDAWAPRVTPSGRALRRVPSDFAPTQGSVTAFDAMTQVYRDNLAHITIAPLLKYHPYPGLKVIPITDLPPCLLVPIWQEENASEAIRAFVEVAARHQAITAA